MCFRRSAQQRGRVLVGKGLQLPSCFRVGKMRMTGSISCYRRRTFGPPSQPGVLSRGSLRTGLQERAAQAAGPASVDGGQAAVAGAC